MMGALLVSRKDAKEQRRKDLKQPQSSLRLGHLGFPIAIGIG
jgi:hypothetical protein